MCLLDWKIIDEVSGPSIWKAVQWFSLNKKSIWYYKCRNEIPWLMLVWILAGPLILASATFIQDQHFPLIALEKILFLCKWENVLYLFMCNCFLPQVPFVRLERLNLNPSEKSQFLVLERGKMVGTNISCLYLY